MIVLSGLLVLLSIILLLVGLLFSEGLGWVYFSIGTSIAAGVFLVLGALQRRGETVQAPATSSPATDGYERVTAVTVTRPEEGAASGGGTAAAASGGQLVSVVPGRPRYHTDSCRFLAGRSDVTQVPVEAAQADGYSACGVCKPDAAAAATEPEPAPEPAAEETRAPEEILADEPAAAAATPRKRTATKVPAKTAGTATKTAAATATKPAVKATATAAKTTAAKTAAKAAPAKDAAPAKAAPAKAASSSVVVIPDRGKFHVETCRFVRDVPGTVTLSKPSAKRQGYVPCGVCKP